MTDPLEGQDDVPIDGTLRIEFSEAMNTTLVEDALDLNFGPGYSVQWEQEDTILVITPHEDLDHATDYKVTITTDAMDLAGNPLDEMFELSFTTAPDTEPPKIVLTDPGDGQLDVSVDALIMIEFSESMDPASVAEALDVNPPFDYEISWNPEHTVLTLSPVGDLIHDTTYSVAVGEEAMDSAGNHLEGTYGFSFTTESS